MVNQGSQETDVPVEEEIPRGRIFPYLQQLSPPKNLEGPEILDHQIEDEENGEPY